MLRMAQDVIPTHPRVQAVLMDGRPNSSTSSHDPARPDATAAERSDGGALVTPFGRRRITSSMQESSASWGEIAGNRRERARDQSSRGTAVQRHRFSRSAHISTASCLLTHSET